MPRTRFSRRACAGPRCARPNPVGRKGSCQSVHNKITRFSAHGLRYNPSAGGRTMGIPGLIVVAVIILYLLNSIKILREYERGVIFRLGRALQQPKGPGIILVFRPFDQMIRVSLRQEVMEVPPQDVITKDNVTIKVNA